MENKKFQESEGVQASDVCMGSVMKHQYSIPEDYRLKPVTYSNYHSVQLQAPSSWAPVPRSQPPEQLKKPQPLEKKNYQQLRSPAAKRPLHAPVTMQGWLYKQGSEGLKVWRKRWFVLSDYCLYYYKGPEEEKVLGSILLPSYKVSMCTSKDKVYRKYAFKCEHANMRTYYLAAESEQSSINWVQAINQACTLQTNVEPSTKPTDSYSHQQHPHQQHPHQQQPHSHQSHPHSHQSHQSLPHHSHPPHPHPHPHPQYNTFSHPHPRTPTPSGPGGAVGMVPVHHVQSVSSISGYDFSGSMQPLYANAPPKPRRVGDGYSTPSPEVFLKERQPCSDRYHGQCYSPYGIPNEERCTPKNNVYLKNCNNCTGYGTIGENIYGATIGTPVHCNHIYDQQIHTPVHRDQNVERRTPDTYGRAKLNSMKMKSDKSDYEDVYADEVIYKRPLSPVAYSNIKKVSPVASIGMHRPYMPVFTSAVPPPEIRIGHKIRTPPIHAQPQQPDRIQSNTIPRPHSADFLDYEVKCRNINKVNPVNRQQPRPKSSLDITGSASDYYYSKESYAENMRKSAMYMQQLPQYHHYSKENGHPGIMNGHDLYQKRKYTHDTPPGRHLGNGSQDSLDINRSASPYAKSPIHLKKDRTYLSNRVESLPRDRDSDRERDRENDYHSEQFKRSASARLLRTPQEELYESVSKDGLQKREESMKRLLEWKQRMLQSPLNRKTSLGCSPMDRPDLYLRPGHYAPQQMPPETHRSYANISMPQYSSYSSDDEENDHNRSKNAKTKSKETHTQSRLLQQAGMAGRTKEDHDSLTISPTPAIISSTTPTRPLNTSSSRPPSVINSTSTLASIPTSRTDSMLELTSEAKSPTLSNTQETKQSFFSDSKNEDTIDNSKNNEQLYEDLLISTPMEITGEENYMTMTPKASVLIPFSTHQRQPSSECDEGAYMEMTKGLGVSLLNQDENLNSGLKLNGDVQPYEIVCFGDASKIEPVYMELNNSAYTGKSLKMNLNKTDDKTGLPDILMQSKNKNSKSDSSDADDEASKDLDSLDTPCHPRFSLSDTFRPASYYLGANRVLTEFHDSSDSELVSPPPIPTSPPPLDDLDHSFFKQEKADNNSNDFSFKRNVMGSVSEEIETDDCFRNKCYLSQDTLKEQDYMSVYSMSSEITKKKLCARSSQNSDSDVELRNSSSSDYVRKLKRRPVSEEFCDELESIDDSSYIDRYLRDLNVCNSSPKTKYKFNKNENIIENDKIPRIKSVTYKNRKSGSSSVDSRRTDSDNTILSMPFSVPYYYSDVSTTATESTNETSILFTLNNQRVDTNASKKHITRLSNPIRLNTDNTMLETRCVSADFLRNKCSPIDKNKLDKKDEENLVYESKHSKMRKTHSLEGLIEFVLNDFGTVTSTNNEYTDESNNTFLDTTQEGSQVWEEDSLWKERLRNASQRQTKSLDNFDQVFNESKSDKKIPKLNPCAENESEVNPGLTSPKKATFTIDRETLRQWDLLSSAPTPSVSQTVTSSTFTVSVTSSSIVTSASSATGNCLSIPEAKIPVTGVVDNDQGQRDGKNSTEFDAQHAASGSIYMQHTSHETFPRAMAKKPWNSSTLTPSRNKMTLPMRPSHSHEFEQSRASPYFYAQSPIPNTPLQHHEDRHRNVPNASWKMNMTAGELLGRTHEELVLLLIQLRRQSTQTCHAIETCYSEIDNIQSQLNNMSAAKRSENLQKLEYLKQHLLELEKQYEKGKPLVNLVDNMVKLGSLYRNPNDPYYNTNVKDRLEFNQQIQEQRLLAEERKDWNRFNSNHTQLQSKVQQLYQLDRLLQEESGTLQCLQYDKEKIERALNGLRLQLNKGYKDPMEIEQARKQQIRLENELSRVHFMLAQNSKKLEETVAGNARLEQELLVLRQKLQLSRQHRSSAQFSNTGAGDSLPCASGTSAMLESELHRVQQLVGDLQRQRQELSVQVRQLTDRSHSLTQQMQPANGTNSGCNTPTHAKRRITTLWRETDLDTMVSIDHGEREDEQPQSAEDIPQEKTEIKTVRIVKRESERRQRDKEKSSSNSDSSQQKWDTVVEEVDDSFNNMYLLNRNLPENDKNSEPHGVDDNNHLLNRLASISSPSLYSQKGSYSADVDSSVDDISIDKSPDLSPVFKSEAARQIIIEMSGGVASEPSTLKKCVRRTVPKEKRRHYTAPHNNILSKSTFEIDNKVSHESRRARDDLDMERALRHRTDTPDVVRSTMNRKELKYNENTIDNILGTPNKISIPERYIPEQLPQLSVEEQRHRRRKVESIKKMLSDTILGSTSSVIKSTENLAGGDKTLETQKATSKMVEEKRQREHLLQLNQILAKQVMEMSKIVAVKALATLPLQPQKMSLEEDDLSPVTPLPLYQQRDNYYS